jgi:hypothetical protein
LYLIGYQCHVKIYQIIYCFYVSRLDSELRGWFEEELGRAGKDENITVVTQLASPLMLPTTPPSPPSPPPPMRLKNKHKRKRPVR